MQDALKKIRETPAEMLEFQVFFVTLWSHIDKNVKMHLRFYYNDYQNTR